MELLPVLFDALAGDPVAVIVSYRSDELPRNHPIRPLRARLRRRERLAEISLTPLDAGALRELLTRLLGGPASQALRRRRWPSAPTACPSTSRN